MENVDDEKESSNSVNEVEDTNSALICGLPDDLSLMCLARVPRKYHSVLKCVSKRWRDLICNEEWCTYRKKHKLDETWIYAMFRDNLNNEIFCYVLDPTASGRYWKLVGDLPSYISRRQGMGFQALGNKLFLLGGCSWSIDCTDEVYSYDASSNCWVEAASLPTARCFFACEVLDEKLYAIGGLVSNPSYSHSWDTFDPLTNCWRSQIDVNISDVEDSVVLDGKIYVRFSRYPVTAHVFAIVYEPSSGTWQDADADMVSGWTGPAVVVDDNLYVLDQTLGTKLMMWHKERRQWILVGKLSPLLTRPPCQLVAVGRSIFIVGNMLSTVVVDVGDLGNEGQVMMASSIPGLLSGFSVISCKCLSI